MCTDPFFRLRDRSERTRFVTRELDFLACAIEVVIKKFWRNRQPSPPPRSSQAAIMPFNAVEILAFPAGFGRIDIGIGSFWR